MEKHRSLGKVGECYPGTKSPTGKNRENQRFPLESPKRKVQASVCCFACFQTRIIPIIIPILLFLCLVRICSMFFLFLEGSFLFFPIFNYFRVTCAAVELHKARQYQWFDAGRENLFLNDSETKSTILRCGKVMYCCHVLYTEIL